VKRILVITAVLALVLPGVGLLADEYAGEMLSIGVGARPMAMGGAFVAVANDATAAYWNPAGLTFIRSLEFSTIHRSEGTRELSGVGYDFFNVALNTGHYGAWAASYLTHSVGDISHTVANPAYNPASPAGLKPYLVLGKFNAKDSAMILSGGYRIADYMAIGANLKYLWSKIADAKATGFGFDAGLLIKPWKKFSVGLNAQDLGGSVSWSNTPTNPTDSIPPNIKVGMAFNQRVAKHMVGFSFDVDTKYNPILHYGLEYWYDDFVAVRAGLVDRGPSFKIDDKDTSVGGGVKLYVITLDYAFVDYELVDAHYFSVIARF